MKLKPFQKEDYARLAIADGAILAHDPGLGKTWAAYTWSFLKAGFDAVDQPSGPRAILPKAPVLIVEPGDLHRQFTEEGMRVFRTLITVLDSQSTFLKLSSIDPHTGRRTLPPGFYITSYTQLGLNGVPRLPNADTADPYDLLTGLGLTEDDIKALYDNAQIPDDHKGFYQTLGISRFAASGIVNHAYNKLIESIDAREDSNKSAQRAAAREAHATLSDRNDRGIYDRHKPAIGYTALPTKARRAIMSDYCRHKYGGLVENIGECRIPGRRYRDGQLEGSMSESDPTPIKCTHAPTLADLCQDAFAAVVVDEATRMKGDDTLIGGAIRQLNPRYRLVLTATPIKNRVPDIFWLAWWATGGNPIGHARWPYAATDKDTFASTFCVSERNITKEQKAKESGGRGRFKKLTPQVCNVHRLWKLLAPTVLRRRKKNIGEQIVGKNVNVYRVPMGTAQAQLYSKHLTWKPRDKNGLPAVGVQLQALRMIAASPGSPLIPLGRAFAYVPKLATGLTLVEQVLRRKEQVIIFSPFHDPLDVLSERLKQANVPHAVLDGRMSQTLRGKIAAQFKLGPPQGATSDRLPVILAGIECMAEGHSFHLCNNQILLSYPWALDKVLQAEERAHRLNSVKALNVYRIICDGSVDRKMESQIDEKEDAAEMVLDGHLLGENPAELNLAELLDIAAQEFNQERNTIDEAILETEWPDLRSRLAMAYQAWVSPAPVLRIENIDQSVIGWRGRFVRKIRLNAAA